MKNLSRVRKWARRCRAAVSGAERPSRFSRLLDWRPHFLREHSFAAQLSDASLVGIVVGAGDRGTNLVWPRGHAMSTVVMLAYVAQCASSLSKIAVR